MWRYLIITEDGDTYGTNDQEVLDEWLEQPCVVIDRKECKEWLGEGWETIDEMPASGDDDAEDAEGEGEDESE